MISLLLMRLILIRIMLCYYAPLKFPCSSEKTFLMNFPSFSFNARLLHNWVGAVLVLPLFIIGMSTFFMSHEKAIGQYVIGYTNEAAELRTLLKTADGRTFLATKAGVYSAIDKDTLNPIKELSSEIRVLKQLADGRLLAAGKYGLWLGELDGSWVKYYDGDIYGVQIDTQHWYLATKRQGVVMSRDEGLSWQPDLQVEILLNSIDGKRPLKLGDFMEELHTGEALMGKKYDWIWADFLAFVLVFLALTGIYMWWKSQKRKLELS
jgi:hypothetical protein